MTLLLRMLLLLAAGFVGTFAYHVPDDVNSYNYNNRNQRTTNTSHAIFCFINGSRVIAPYIQQSYQTSHFSRNDLPNFVDMCTHLVYDAAELVRNRGEIDIKAIDQGIETGLSDGRITFQDLIAQKNNRRETRKPLKVFLSLSGSSELFWEAVSKRETFAKKVTDYLDAHKFDGLIINWQLAGRNPQSNDNMERLTQFMSTLKRHFRGETKELGAVLPLQKLPYNSGYDFDNDVLMDSVDHWIIMTVDYNTDWSTLKANAPLRSTDTLNIENSVAEYKKVFRDNKFKLILAIPFGGKMMTLKSEYGQDPSPRHGVETEHPTARLTYREVCLKLNSPSEGWKREWNTLENSPFIYKQKTVITYDDQESVKRKTWLALREGLGGVMAYTVDQDDYVGDCTLGHKTTSNSYNSNFNNNGNNKYDNNYKSQDNSAGKFPLLQSMYDAVQRGPNSAGLQSSPMALVLAVVAAMILKHFD